MGQERHGGLLLQLGQITQASVLGKLSLLAGVTFLTPFHYTEGEKPHYPLLKTKNKAALELSQEANRMLGSLAKQNWVQQGRV